MGKGNDLLRSKLQSDIDKINLKLKLAAKNQIKVDPVGLGRELQGLQDSYLQYFGNYYGNYQPNYKSSGIISTPVSANTANFNNAKDFKSLSIDFLGYSNQSNNTNPFITTAHQQKLYQQYFQSPAATYTYGTWQLKTAPEPEPLEVVKSDMPILAARWAKLCYMKPERPSSILRHNELGLMSVAHPYPIDLGLSMAQCAYQDYNIYGAGCSCHNCAKPPHTAPEEDCSCGFYAVPPDLLKEHNYNQTLTLLVELTGKVIEHEKGYRAQYQKVCEIRLSRCGCGDLASALLFEHCPLGIIAQRPLCKNSYAINGKEYAIKYSRDACPANIGMHHEFSILENPLEKLQEQFKGVPVTSW